MSSSKSGFHPEFAVSNVRNDVPVVLEIENVQYSTWAELFRNHAKSCKVLHHIVANDKLKAPTIDEEQELWDTLDAIVLKWIYSTISNDLLQIILVPGAKAMEA